MASAIVMTPTSGEARRLNQTAQGKTKVVDHSATKPSSEHGASGGKTEICASLTGAGSFSTVLTLPGPKTAFAIIRSRTTTARFIGVPIRLSDYIEIRLNTSA